MYPINLLQKKHAYIIVNCLMSHKFGQNSTKESGTQLFLLKKKNNWNTVHKGSSIFNVTPLSCKNYLINFFIEDVTKYRKPNFVFVFHMKIWKKPPSKVDFIQCLTHPHPNIRHLWMDLNQSRPFNFAQVVGSNAPWLWPNHSTIISIDT